MVYLPKWIKNKINYHNGLVNKLITKMTCYIIEKSNKIITCNFIFVKFVFLILYLFRSVDNAKLIDRVELQGFQIQNKNFFKIEFEVEGIKIYFF